MAAGPCQASSPARTSPLTIQVAASLLLCSTWLASIERRSTPPVHHGSRNGRATIAPASAIKPVTLSPGG